MQPELLPVRADEGETDECAAVLRLRLTENIRGLFFQHVSSARRRHFDGAGGPARPSPEGAWPAMDSRCSSSADSRLTGRGLGSITTTPVCARVESYEAAEKKCISDVRRTFCLFVTFDLLFITLLWIIELNLLAVFRFAALILAYAVCKLRHWWAIAVTTAVSCAFLIVKVILSKLLSQGAFGYLLPIISFVLAWIETWLLDFKFYSPPESVADSDEDLDDKHDPEKGLIQQDLVLFSCS
ncbi:hypothetical protein INR49_005491 [Caranx melampygus]|nr:hypothetical protein INR49_005491 [Caranx melampygus]